VSDIAGGMSDNRRDRASCTSAMICCAWLPLTTPTLT
jgi:hypothetical protein